MWLLISGSYFGRREHTAKQKHGIARVTVLPCDPGLTFSITPEFTPEEKAMPEGAVSAEEILRIRKGLRLTQEAFGKHIGVDRRTIIRWERGEVAPHPCHRRALKVLVETGVSA